MLRSVGNGPERGPLTEMKNGIHPKYYQATVTCSTCGNTFTVGSTKPSILVDTCSNCHSFYTGKLNLNAKAGRIEAFNKKLNKTSK